MSGATIETADWVRDPLLRCIEYVEEVDKSLELSIRGIRAVTGMYPLKKALVGVDSRDDDLDPDEERELTEFKQLTDVASSEVERGFPMLHRQSVVALWTALEVLVDDLLGAWIRSAPQARENDAITEVKIPLTKFWSLDDSDRVDLLVEEYKRSVGAAFKPGIAGFQELLAPSGLDVPLDDGTKRDFVELRAVRNVVVHCAAVADRKFADRCPWLEPAPGDEVKITGDRYKRFSRAIIVYLVGIGHKAGLDVPHPDELLSTHDRHEQ